MPSRKIPLVTDHYYHIFNRGVNKQPIFFSMKDYKRALETLEFYSYSPMPLRYSKFLQLNRDERTQILFSLKKTGIKLISFICFCLMPNHFHFLLKQKVDGGITRFMSNFQNSFTRYSNTKYEMIGPLLQGEFKSVLAEDDSQLLHLSRYIHLNPYTSAIVKDVIELESYPWSSYAEYVKDTSMNFCDKEIVLSFFKNKDEYKNFVWDRVAYQRELARIKHILLE